MDEICKFGEQTSRILEFKPEGLEVYFDIKVDAICEDIIFKIQQKSLKASISEANIDLRKRQRTQTRLNYKDVTVGCPKIGRMKKSFQIFFASGLSHSLGPWDTPKKNSNQSDFL